MSGQRALTAPSSILLSLARNTSKLLDWCVILAAVAFLKELKTALIEIQVIFSCRLAISKKHKKPFFVKPPNPVNPSKAS
jgi:hypothetical protein